ncbi:FAD-dependent monooxygenase [Herbiconiux sp.]|uniref:FAD-dependent monooxygenase n=1 Tax=Herbiconiux sp. TaxID=1871186 RepID=UPI0025BF8978|nr:FAD-dependent monooxygenase [Herbiconiux sp.]
MTQHPEPAAESLEQRVWDVIVVGAGPAGSTAARRAAEGGASVLLLDRAAFPRYKTCGGGLLGESLALLPDGARATVESRVRETVFTDRFRRRFVLRRPQPYLAMVRRAEFDQALASAAQDAGVRFADGVTVRSVAVSSTAATPDDASAPPPPVSSTGAPLDDAVAPSPVASTGSVGASVPPVTLVTTAGTLRARVVIGADGTGGRIGRYVGVQPGGVDLGLEDEVRMPDGAAAAAWRDRVLLDWGGSPGSYAWVFPKQDSLTIGVIQRKGAPDETREYLAAWRRHLGLTEADAETLHSSGHLTQWRRPGSPLRRGPVLVAGDAAGLLEPWTREGISFALRSGGWAGEAAARAVAALGGSRPESTTHAHPATGSTAESPPESARAAFDAELDTYRARVEAVLQPEQVAGAGILSAFERHRGLVHTLLRTPFGARYFVRFCRGETTLARVARHRSVQRAVRLLGASAAP